MSRKYYLPKDARPAYRWLSDKLIRKSVLAAPETVLIETQSGCNARCVFCPIADDDIRRAMPSGRMSHDMFRKILDELVETPPKHIIPCFANEPFLDQRLIDWLIEIRERLPDSEVTVVTNGSLITKQIATRLLEAQVPDVLSISFQSVEKTTYQAIMGPLDFDETRARALDLIRRKKERRLRRPEIKVSMVETQLTGDEIEAARRFWSEHDVKFEVDRLENRGGSIRLDELSEKTVPYSDCRRPFNTLVIAFDGKVPLCCVDFERHVIVGDLTKQTIGEIWNSDRLTDIRRSFLDSNRRSSLPPTCQDCRLAE